MANEQNKLNPDEVLSKLSDLRENLRWALDDVEALTNLANEVHREEWGQASWDESASLGVSLLAEVVEDVAKNGQALKALLVPRKDS